MKRVFATVGTTSFDDFVQSLCSLPFLIEMSNHYRETSSPSVPSPSFSPSLSASLSSSGALCPGPSLSSCSTSFSSSSAVASSSTFSRHDEDIISDPSLELAIQYGKGQCPISFLPSSLFATSKIPMKDDDNKESSSGSILLSIPVGETMQLSSDRRGRRSEDDAMGNHKSTQNTDNSNNQNLYRVRVRWYRFQPSLSDEMENADLILCHAGAGTLLEALDISSSSKSAGGKRKIINAVINSKLMDNHQSELAEELERRKHILVTRDCTSEWTADDAATQFWNGIRDFSPMAFLGGRSRNDRIHMERQEPKDSNEYDVSSSFQRIVDRVMGFHANMNNNTKKAR